MPRVKVPLVNTPRKPSDPTPAPLLPSVPAPPTSETGALLYCTFLHHPHRHSGMWRPQPPARLFTQLVVHYTALHCAALLPQTEDCRMRLPRTTPGSGVHRTRTVLHCGRRERGGEREREETARLLAAAEQSRTREQQEVERYGCEETELNFVPHYKGNDLGISGGHKNICNCEEAFL